MNRKKAKKNAPSLQLDTNCVVCYQPQTIFAIGVCDHPLCYKCSSTLRVVCSKKGCPVCRRLLVKVYFTKTLDTFENLEKRPLARYNKKYGIVFEDMEIKNSFEEMIGIFCTKCHGHPTFSTFELLLEHMERLHKLYSCPICVKHLKVLTKEVRWYKYNELMDHMTYKKETDSGHPLCVYCNIHLHDKDEYDDHLRTEHKCCFICDEDVHEGQFFKDLDSLVQHYHDVHFPCIDEDCLLEYYSVFRTPQKLKAHYKRFHKNMLTNQSDVQPNTSKAEDVYLCPNVVVPYVRDALEYSTRLVSGSRDSRVHNGALLNEYHRHNAMTRELTESLTNSMSQIDIKDKKENVTNKNIVTLKEVPQKSTKQPDNSNSTKKLEPLNINLATSSKTENAASAQMPLQNSKTKKKQGLIKDGVKQTSNNDTAAVNVKSGVNNQNVAPKNKSIDVNQCDSGLLQPSSSIEQMTDGTESNSNAKKKKIRKKKNQTVSIPALNNEEESVSLPVVTNPERTVSLHALTNLEGHSAYNTNTMATKDDFFKWCENENNFYKYVNPPGMPERIKVFNKQIMWSFNRSNKAGKVIQFEKFQKAYSLFMKDELSARRLYEYCSKEIHEGYKMKIFIELIFLCPDILKQKLLLIEYLMNLGKLCPYLHVCNVCQQLLHENDIKKHAKHHTMKSEQ